MNDPTPYIRTDASGVMKMGATEISLDSVLHAWRQGHSPETIRSQYPDLLLEEIYGAIAWSLKHAEEVEAYLERQNEVWETATKRAAESEPPAMQRLRGLKSANARGN